MAGRKKGIDKAEESLMHIFDDIYLGHDELNMVIIRKSVAKKSKKVSFINVGYFISAKALLSNLYDRYALARIKDSTIHKTEALIGIENFVNKVENIKAEFDKVNKWK